jgi:hypothetical protein
MGMSTSSTSQRERLCPNGNVYAPTGTSTDLSPTDTPPSSHVACVCELLRGMPPRSHAAFLRAPMGPAGTYRRALTWHVYGHSCGQVYGPPTACLADPCPAARSPDGPRRVVGGGWSAVGGRHVADSLPCPALRSPSGRLATSRICQICPSRPGRLARAGSLAVQIRPSHLAVERAGIGCRRSGLPRNVQRPTADDADLPAKRPVADCSRRGSPRGTSSGRLSALWVPAVRTAAGCSRRGSLRGAYGGRLSALWIPPRNIGRSSGKWPDRATIRAASAAVATQRQQVFRPE